MSILTENYRILVRYEMRISDMVDASQNLIDMDTQWFFLCLNQSSCLSIRQDSWIEFASVIGSHQVE